MNKQLSIQFNRAIVEENTLELKFVKDVIHSLFQLDKHLGFELSFIINENYMAINKKAFEILESEGIQFTIVNQLKPESYSINKIESRFEIFYNEQRISYFKDWNEIVTYLKTSLRKVAHLRKTTETEIEIELNPDGNGIYNISTRLGFFNHMLEQFSKHSLIDLSISVKGDLHIDEHHTIEDTAIALGEAVVKALGNKKGMERYGFLLPMDDCLAQVAIDFGGRSWLVWEADFRREKIGDMPTEMFYHFFKSFSDAAKCNVNIKAQGFNEHHKIESIFKAFAKAVKMAVSVNFESNVLPTTKGIL